MAGGPLAWRTCVAMPGGPCASGLLWPASRRGPPGYPPPAQRTACTLRGGGNPARAGRWPTFECLRPHVWYPETQHTSRFDVITKNLFSKTNCQIFVTGIRIQAPYQQMTGSQRACILVQCRHTVCSTERKRSQVLLPTRHTLWQGVGGDDLHLLHLRRGRRWGAGAARRRVGAVVREAGGGAGEGRRGGGRRKP